MRLAPALIEFDGKHYLVPEWKEIKDPENFSKYYEDYFRNLPKPNFQKFRVKSSTSNRVYTVIKDGDEYSCNCLGFRFHGHCKHIQEIMLGRS